MRPVLVDVSDHRATITRAAAQLLDRLVLWPHTNQPLAQPVAVFDDCLTGKIAEAGFALATGRPVDDLLDDGPGRPDWPGIDVKAITPGSPGLTIATTSLSGKSLAFRWIGVKVQPSTWRTWIVGQATAEQVRAMPVQPPTGGRRTGYVRIRCDQLTAVPELWRPAC